MLSRFFIVSLTCSEEVKAPVLNCRPVSGPVMATALKLLFKIVIEAAQCAGTRCR
jgi:hypothetical protein